MENFSASSLEEGPSRRRSLRKRRDHQRRLNLIDESSEEEEETFKVNDYEEDQDDFEECHEEDEAVAGNVGKRKVEGPFLNGSVSWRVSDPDVLDCPVCYELLTIPVFQVCLSCKFKFLLYAFIVRYLHLGITMRLNFCF